jgi:tetratricopeptide (TPR) repeat protein
MKAMDPKGLNLKRLNLKNLKRFSLLALCVAVPTGAVSSGTLALPALASPAPNHLNMGVSYYKAGDYNKALAYLQSAVSKQPKVWQGHYYLGNTYLTLGRRNEAYDQYVLCQNCKPTPQIAAACSEVIGRIASRSQIEAQNEVSRKGQDSKAHEQYLIMQKRAILHEAELRGQTNSDHTMDQITNSINSNGTMSLQDSEMATLADKQRASRMQIETNRKNAEIYENARRRAQEIR